MSELEKLAAEVLFVLMAIAAACGITWFAADAHYSKALSSLEGQLKGAGAAQQKAVKATEDHDAEVTKGVNDAAKLQIAGMDSDIAALRLRLESGAGAVRVCPPAPGSLQPYVQPDGPGVAAGDRQSTVPGRPDVEVAIARDTLVSSLGIGIDALRAELLWRTYARGTGQVKP